MGLDDDQGPCTADGGHVWRLVAVVLEWPGSLSTYECDACGAVLPVTAGDPKPGTV